MSVAVHRLLDKTCALICARISVQLVAVKEAVISTRRRYIDYDGVIGGRLRTWTDIQGLGRVSDTTSKNGNIPAFAPLNGIQVTESESHPSWRSRSRGRSKGDIGGPFDTRKRYAVGNPKNVTLQHVNTAAGRSDGALYMGPLMPTGPGELVFPPFADTSNDDLAEMGTKAISLCSPTNPSSDFLTFGGELVRDGLPSLAGSTLKGWGGLSNQKRRKAIGGEYLNYQFGWVPFASDLNRLAKSALDAEDLLSQLLENSGQVVRRKYVFPPEETLSETTPYNNRSPWYSPSSSLLQNNSLVNQGKVVRSSEVRKLRWFSGAFTYYIPPADNLLNEMRRVAIESRRLFGVSLTPDVIWNLAPWSWAIDWFGPFGDFLSNLSDLLVSNQVLKYGYMMEHTISTYTYTFVGPTGYYPDSARPRAIKMVSETKKRVRATPYGFGLRWEDFSPTQWAVTTALGLVRS